MTAVPIAGPIPVIKNTFQHPASLPGRACSELIDFPNFIRYTGINRKPKLPILLNVQSRKIINLVKKAGAKPAFLLPAAIRVATEGGYAMLRLPLRFFLIVFLSCFSAAPSANAHFGLVLPSDDIITADGPKTIEIRVRFMHPMECQYLEMAKPKKFGVAHHGKTEDLLGALTAQAGNCPGREGSFQYWKTSFP